MQTDGGFSLKREKEHFTLGNAFCMLRCLLKANHLVCINNKLAELLQVTGI